MTRSKKYYQLMEKSDKYLMEKLALEAEISFKLMDDSARHYMECLFKEAGSEPTKIPKLKNEQEIKRVRNKLGKAKSDIGKKITESLDAANQMLENYQKFLSAESFDDGVSSKNKKLKLKSNKILTGTDQKGKLFKEKIENDRELFLRNVFPAEKISQLIENILTSKNNSDINDKIYRFTIINSLLQICLKKLFNNVDENYKDFVKKDIVQIKNLSASILAKIESGKS